jgi:hypothetical protein
MAKFNKDTFLNSIVNRVQNALNKGLLSREDIDNNNLERLHGFIQYELLEYIEDRKFAIDVLKDFNYDEKTPWDALQKEYGTFKSLMDIALINLWKFLKSEKVTEYSYYSVDDIQNDKPMLDIVHDMEDLPEKHIKPRGPENGVDITNDHSDENIIKSPEETGRPRRKIRLANK